MLVFAIADRFSLGAHSYPMPSLALAHRTVAVTGGGGLIGSFLVDDLLEIGAKVVAIDDFSTGSKAHLAHVADHIQIREGNLEQPGFAADALAGCDVVFHLASRPHGVGYMHGRHLEVCLQNERVTDNLLAAAAHLRPDHLLVASSSCVHRDDGPDTFAELPVFDGEPERVNRGYGWAKRFLEQKSQLLSEETGIPVTIVRPVNIYGERYTWRGEHSQAIPMLVHKVLRGDDPIEIWGSGRQRRNYMHAADCARLMRRLVEVGHTDGPVNIGLEDTLSVGELVDLICRVSGRSPQRVFDTSKPEGRFVKSADSTKLRRILGHIDAGIAIEDGLRRMLDWHRHTFEDA